MPIIVEADAYTDADLEKLVDEDISNFDAYFQSLGNDPLSRFERSTIKTFMHWKTHEEPRAPSPPATPEEKNAT